MTYFEYILQLKVDELAEFLSDFIIAQQDEQKQMDADRERFYKDMRKFLLSEIDLDVYLKRQMIL